LGPKFWRHSKSNHKPKQGLPFPFPSIFKAGLKECCKLPQQGLGWISSRNLMCGALEFDDTLNSICVRYLIFQNLPASNLHFLRSPSRAMAPSDKKLGDQTWGGSGLILGLFN